MRSVSSCLHGETQKNKFGSKFLKKSQTLGDVISILRLYPGWLLRPGKYFFRLERLKLGS